MKLFEEFKEYETLWEDSATEPNKKEYLISYEDKVFNLATEEGLQSYITLRAPKLGKKKVRAELKQIIGHDKEPTSREYIEAKNELIDIAGKLEAVGALFKVPLQDAQSTGIFYKMRRRLYELDDSFKPQYEAARLKLLNVVESTNEKAKTSKTSHSTESSCMWTTPDGRQIDLNNPTAVAEEIDHLVQVTEQDYISYNNKRVASGKPAKDFSKLLKSQRDVLVHEFNHLRDAIIAPSTVVDKKTAAAEELNRYYYAYDTGALVPKTVHEELKLDSKLHEVKSSDITIIGCDLEETINHMQKHGRCPKLPYGWFIDIIDDTDSDSRIVFSHRRLPLTVWFYCKYYMGSSYDQCKYELYHYISIDDTEFDHDMETFTIPSPEDFVKRIFDLVTEFNSIWENSDDKNFVKKLRAAGYKRH